MMSGVRLRMMSPMSSKKVKMMKRVEKEKRTRSEVGGVLAHDVVVEQQRELDAEGAAEAAQDGGDVGGETIGDGSRVLSRAGEASEELVEPRRRWRRRCRERCLRGDIW